MVEASLLLLEDEAAFGKVLMVHVNGRLYEWRPPKGNLAQIRAPSQAAGAPAKLPCLQPPWGLPRLVLRID